MQKASRTVQRGAVARKNSIKKLSEAVAELSGNSALASDFVNVMRRSGTSTQRNFARVGAFSGYDSLHNNLFQDFGYPNDLKFADYWSMYRRFGMAKTIVEIYPDYGWKEDPIVKGSDEFNSALEELNKRVKLWTRLKSFDKRQRVGNYAGLFILVADNLTPEQAMQKVTDTSSVLRLIPYYENQLYPQNFDNNPVSITYGMPKQFQIQQTQTGASQATPSNQINVDASRIITISEEADDGGLYGKSQLEDVFNDLMNVQKIAGSTAEGMYRNAAQSISFELQDAESWDLDEDELDALEAELDDFTRNRMRRSLVVPGMKANPVNSTMINPKDPFEVVVDAVVAGKRIPRSLLLGKQTGVKAGDQDTEAFLANVAARQNGFQTDLVRLVIDWFIQWGALPASDYEVEWVDPMARSDEEKLSNAEKMASVNEKQFRSGQGAVFTEEEIREAAGFETESEDDLPPEADDDAELIE